MIGVSDHHKNYLQSFLNASGIRDYWAATGHDSLLLESRLENPPESIVISSTVKDLDPDHLSSLLKGFWPESDCVFVDKEISGPQIRNALENSITGKVV